MRFNTAWGGKNDDDGEDTEKRQHRNRRETDSAIEERNNTFDGRP